MTDILVLGATGFTGRLITRYLSSHPQRADFTFAIGARSLQKLNSLVNELGLGKDVELVEVDVTNLEDVERAVLHTRVVINTVGPYWRWGRFVVKACAKHGKGYVDLTGETPWVRRMIFKYDYLASKTGAIIIPSCGMDSIPSDVIPFLANKTLKTLVGPDACLGSSITGIKLTGGVSGGTLSTVMTMLEEVPRKELRAASHDFSLSPAIRGLPTPKARTVYTLPFSSPTVYGSFFVMSSTNRAVVQRTWGLHQLAALRGEKELAYGPEFTYDEFMVTRSAFSAVVFTVGLAFAGMALLLYPVRWILKKIRPPGSGPSDETMEAGSFEATNVTSSTPDASGKRTHVRTILRGRGDPGYLLTSIMIAECALSIVLERDNLPSLAHEGGILTPMSALGDVLIGRLKGSGRFDFESEVVLTARGESRKTR